MLNRSDEIEKTPKATVGSPAGDLELQVYTTEPYLQLYLGKGIEQELNGKDGTLYGPFGGLCLECQGYPDGVNQPSLGNILLKPGEKRESRTLYKILKAS